MTQPSPTPVPGHGTGWGLLALFVALYGIVAVLGVGTIVAAVVNRLDRSLPAVFRYLVAAVLLGSLGLAGFTALVAGSAGRYDVVALLLCIVALPLVIVVLRRRETARGRVPLLAHAALVWSLPFLVGFGVIAFLGTEGRLVPEITGALAVVIVVGGTVGLDRSPWIPTGEGS